MKSWTKLALAALLMGGAAAIGSATPASAQISLSIGIGGGDYNPGRSCSWYRYHDFPAPRRCYGYFQGVYGANVYVDGDFIFRDHDDWNRWRSRDDYQHWRNHQFRHQDWARSDHGDHGYQAAHGGPGYQGDQGYHGDHQANGDHRDNGNNRDNGNHRDHGDHQDNGNNPY